MKIIGIVPARYGSTRLPAKPLADIYGKPLVWWAYNQAVKVKTFDELYVATDSEQIGDVCEQYTIPFLMTSSNCVTATDRLVEVSEMIDADVYTIVNGDEPLIDPADIDASVAVVDGNVDVGVLCCPLASAIETINPSIHKFALNNANEVIYVSRQPIPFPQSRIDYTMYKCIGTHSVSKRAIQLYRDTPMGRLESVESNDLLRFLENHITIKAVITEHQSLSVDTAKDLAEVRKIILSIQGEKNG
ncbi:MAG: 3-deoxy-manno-octulosonate cytidylyltransferase [Treponema sp.]|nr:3-deoxy-manno-octulosonate cytidylyltransferase [Treponema sp.]